jgi:hypothetical protein
MRVNGAFDPATPERLTRGLRKMATTVLEDTPVKCRVRGRDAACHRLVMDSGEGRQSVLISAVGEAKHMMVVTCLWKSGPMPAMCTDILAVEDVSAPR